MFWARRRTHKVYARQSESLENEECKSEGETQKWLFIKAEGGNKWHIIIAERETIRILILTATRTPPQFMNRQTMMTAEPTVRHNAPFKGALMGFSTAQYPLVELLG